MVFQEEIQSIYEWVICFSLQLLPCKVCIHFREEGNEMDPNFFVASLSEV